MRSIIWTVLLFALALVSMLAVQPSPVRADQIHWVYNWVPGKSAIAAGTGGISLTNEPAANATGSSDITVTNIRTFSAALPTAPDQVTNGGYSFNLYLTDSASGATGSLHFTGLFGGTLSNSSAKITNLFTGPTVQSLTLGGNLYTVTFGPYSPPGPPDAFNAGSIAAHVNVQNETIASSPPPGSGTPEPGTGVLAGLGLSLTAAVSWVHRRPRQQPS